MPPVHLTNQNFPANAPRNKFGKVTKYTLVKEALDETPTIEYDDAKRFIKEKYGVVIKPDVFHTYRNLWKKEKNQMVACLVDDNPPPRVKGPSLVPINRVLERVQQLKEIVSFFGKDVAIDFIRLFNE